MSDAVTLERQIGTPPGDRDFRLTPHNKELVQQWLIEQGLDPARIEGARESTLRKAYAEAHYLRHLKTRRDYNPSCGGAAMTDRSPFTIHREEAPQPAPAAPVADPMKAFAEALRTMLPSGGITEDRVLELIYDHVPGLVRLALADLLGDAAAKLSNEE